jgi:hypothetical protein
MTAHERISKHSMRMFIRLAFAGRLRRAIPAMRNSADRNFPDPFRGKIPHLLADG